MRDEDGMVEGKTFRISFTCYGCEVQYSAENIEKILPLINEHKDC